MTLHRREERKKDDIEEMRESGKREMIFIEYGKIKMIFCYFR